jgi:RimJ/RimL family protein N-acetyltransferase
MDILIWRNDIVSRKTAFNQNPIHLNDHLAWFRNILKDNTVKLYMIEAAYRKIGVVRFSFDKDVEVHINLNPEFRGKGLGAEALKLAIDKYVNDTKRDEIYAKIKNNNRASLKIFKKCGFKRIKEFDDYSLLCTYIDNSYNIKNENINFEGVIDGV